ncbi:hypothetical protein GCM10017744_030370 [Streptomyces antimycoticus]
MTQTEVPIDVELRGLYKAHYRFQFLSAGFQLGLFALVEKEPGLAVREIAARLDLKEQPTRILLLGCTVFGLLHKDGEGYHTTPLSKPLTANFDEAPASNIPWEQHGIYGRWPGSVNPSRKTPTSVCGGKFRERRPPSTGGSPKIPSWRPHSTP